MIFGKEKSLKDEIINTGKKLYCLRLVVAHSGNLSCRLDDNNILITATGLSLGNLTYEDIIKVDISSAPKAPLNINPERSPELVEGRSRRIGLSRQEELKKKPVSTEFPLHSLVYKNSPHKVVIHAHPILVNAYFCVYSELKALTFETKLFLGNIPVVEQDTPAIAKPEPVIEALKVNNLVVIKNHGVICVADKFSDALYLIESLEEAVKLAATARLFKKDILDNLDKVLKEDFNSDNAYLMFSKEHIQAIVDLVNKDEFIAKKGQELDLTLKLAIKLDGHDKTYKFNFQKGRIVNLEFDEDAPFVISAPVDAWELVFLGKLDPFVATMQGKMKLKGELGKLSRWYVPFSRLFELFKQVRIK